MDRLARSLLTTAVLAGLSACGGGGSGEQSQVVNSPVVYHTVETSFPQTEDTRVWEPVDPAIPGAGGVTYVRGIYQDRFNRLWLSRSASFIDGPPNGAMQTSTDEGATWTTVITNVMAPVVRCVTPSGRVLTDIGYADSSITSITPYTTKQPLWSVDTNGDGVINDQDGPALDSSLSHYYPVHCDDNGLMFRNGMNLDEVVGFSLDQGKTWYQSAKIANHQFWPNYVPVKSDTGVLFIPSKNGLLRSVDGMKWTNIDLGASISSVVNSPKTADELIAVSLYGEILRSQDNGSSWTELTTLATEQGGFIDMLPTGDYYGQLTNSTAPILAVAKDGELVVAGMIDTAKNPKAPKLTTVFYRSTDNGKSWNSLPNTSAPATKPGLIPNATLIITDKYYWWHANVAARLPR